MSKADLEPLYGEVITEMVEELKQVIRDTIGDEQLSFADFESFYQWWDVTTAFDQLDDDVNVADQKPILKVAYKALVVDGFFSHAAP